MNNATQVLSNNYDNIINFWYIVAAVFFIFGLKQLTHPSTAKKGNLYSAVGMFIAVIVTMLNNQIISYEYILAGIGIGTILGVYLANYVTMNQMPEMVAALNGLGGLASLLVGFAEYLIMTDPDLISGVATVAAIIIGGVTFTGSIVAYLKLSEKVKSNSLLSSSSRYLNAVMLLTTIALGALLVTNYLPVSNEHLVICICIISLLLGITSVLPIGGADMPVVISLLNSYSGIAAAAAGFVIMNNILIVTGSLVGASGIILTNIMCKAMNRSLSNVLFGSFANQSSSSSAQIEGSITEIKTDNAFMVLESAKSVLFVPGYGLAVSQAQHAVKELTDYLQENGSEVRFAIHPVAGRMPGHMNVLLSEANIPYDLLVGPEDVNNTIDQVDVCVIIGANDVVNPSARDDQTSPIYGMPIIDVDKAKSVFVLKRSMNAGFSGLTNPLFFNNNTSMLFGDAKGTLTAIITEFKELVTN